MRMHIYTREKRSSSSSSSGNRRQQQRRSSPWLSCCTGSGSCLPALRRCCARMSRCLPARLLGGRAFRGSSGAAGSRAATTAGATVRVEPKTFFANERTLLQWLNIAVLLASVAITLLSFGQTAAKAAGLLLAPVAIFFIGYSFWVGRSSSSRSDERSRSTLKHSAAPSSSKC